MNSEKQKLFKALQ